MKKWIEYDPANEIEEEKVFRFLGAEAQLIRVLVSSGGIKVEIVNELEYHRDVYYDHPDVDALTILEENNFLPDAILRAREVSIGDVSKVEVELNRFIDGKRIPYRDVSTIQNNLLRLGFGGDIVGLDTIHGESIESVFSLFTQQNFIEITRVNKQRKNILVLEDTYKKVTISLNDVEGLEGQFVEIEVLTDGNNHQKAKEYIENLKEVLLLESVIDSIKVESYGVQLLRKIYKK